MYREISDFILGDRCFICHHHFIVLQNHRIDGSRHKPLNYLLEDELIDELGSGNYIRTCNSCHHLIHSIKDINKEKWRNNDYLIQEERMILVREYRGMITEH